MGKYCILCFGFSFIVNGKLSEPWWPCGHVQLVWSQDLEFLICSISLCSYAYPVFNYNSKKYNKKGLKLVPRFAFSVYLVDHGDVKNWCDELMNLRRKWSIQHTHDSNLYLIAVYVQLLFHEFKYIREQKRLCFWPFVFWVFFGCSCDQGSSFFALQTY